MDFITLSNALSAVITYVANNSVAAVAIAAFIMSLFTFFYQYMRDGKLIFSRPTFIGATQYLGGVKNDVLLLPLSVANTGVHAKTLRFGLILSNNKVFYHQQIDLDNVPLPEPNEPFSLKDHRFAPTPMTVMPMASAVKIVGFTQLGYLTKINTEPIFDLFYNQGKEWKFALRINWKSFISQQKDYQANPNGLTSTTMGFEILYQKPEYDFKSILEVGTIKQVNPLDKQVGKGKK